LIGLFAAKSSGGNIFLHALAPLGTSLDCFGWHAAFPRCSDNRAPAFFLAGRQRGRAS
jgi:hypothetical protein